MNVQFETGITNIKDVKVATITKNAITALKVEGQTVKISDRFWVSLSAKYGLPGISEKAQKGMFSLWDPETVFKQIAEQKGGTIQFTIAHEGGKSTLLAIANAKKSLPPGERVINLLKQFGPKSIDYQNGVMTGRFVPESGSRLRVIGSDEFQNRYAMEVPVDGYGSPSTFLELFRLICGNGAVGYNSAFRQTINLGDDPLYTLERALANFDSGEGFERIRSRFAMAQKSNASIGDFQRLRAAMTSNKGYVGATDEMQAALEKICPQILLYKATAINLNAYTPKKQELLPAGCRVYDLINFASELATHHAGWEEAKFLHGWIGETVAKEFDLEGSARNEPKEFDDLLIPAYLRKITAMNLLAAVA